MMVAQKDYKIGDVVKVKGILGYPLPAGLCDGDQVTVIAMDVDLRIVGKGTLRWTVQGPNIDSGFEPYEPKSVKA